jgi:uncharacterized protein YecE (DUF72 family)
MTIRVGISGWRYPPWRGDFYPADLPQRRELEYAASQLGSIEVNGSFYSLQRPSSWTKWREEVPEDFVFSVKGGRFITHMRRLRDVEVALANFFAQGVLALGPKLGPILWQLPANFRWDADVVRDFFAMLPRTTTEAAELAGRHDDKVSGDKLWSGTVDDRPLHHALEATSACTVTRSSTPAATARRRSRRGRRSCAAGPPTGATPSSTSTTTSRATRPTTHAG